MLSKKKRRMEIKKMKRMRGGKGVFKLEWFKRGVDNEKKL